jgi:hypothetical protein
MEDYFNFQQWEQWIKEPLWYLKIDSSLQYLPKLREINLEKYEQYKTLAYDFFENHLIKGDIYLGTEGKNWDKDRKSIDTIIIHHTSLLPGLSKERLSAIELFRLYVKHYAHPSLEDQDIVNQPIYSHHFRDDKQVFYTYHWIIRGNGEVERLLFDDEIGWHLSNWDINCRSVALVFDNDYENSQPSLLELQTAAQLIKNNYPQVSKERIFGHREINTYTTCPSNLFLSTPERKGWKEKLLNLI